MWTRSSSALPARTKWRPCSGRRRLRSRMRPWSSKSLACVHSWHQHARRSHTYTLHRRRSSALRCCTTMTKPRRTKPQLKPRCASVTSRAMLSQLTPHIIISGGGRQRRLRVGKTARTVQSSERRPMRRGTKALGKCRLSRAVLCGRQVQQRQQQPHHRLHQQQQPLKLHLHLQLQLRRHQQRRCCRCWGSTGQDRRVSDVK